MRWINRANAVRTGLLCLLAMAAAPVLSARAEGDISDPGRRVYRVRALEAPGEAGVPLSREVEEVVESAARLHREVRDGKPIYLAEKTDRLRQGDRVLWTFTLDPENLGLLRIEKKVISRSGQTVRESWTDFRDPMFDYPADLCHIYTIAEAVRALPLQVGGRHDIHLLLNEDSMPWHMFVLVEAEETVTVPAGTFACYRLSLEPDFRQIMGKWSWASSLIKPFVPDYYFWVEKAGTHVMVQFQGKFGPVGAAPTQAYELLRLEPLSAPAP